MTTYKQIQANFWQNTFVLDLTPEERYFYVYLITNTMTTVCGIYRFNLKLAVLETGLSSEVINNYLNTFESSGKIVISKVSRELMIVNWLKHNSKMNKKIIGQINAELKEVKDKELLRQYYEICKERQYPVEAIFNGVVLPSEVKIKADNEVKIKPDNENEIEPDDIVQSVQEAAKPEEKDVEAVSKDKLEEGKENQEMLFTGFKPVSTGKRRRKAKEKPDEEIEAYETFGEDDQEQAIKGTTVATWNFNDSGGSSSSNALESCCRLFAG
ncbi:MAG: hypothetical protein Q8930_07485 [Bacillota bacterium]|nr:hypothetical protein [Bacillota bacterium]